MFQRLLLLIKLFVVTVAICTLQKPLFMLYHLSSHSDVGLKDVADVMLHSLSLDATIAGYISVLPWLLLFASMFILRVKWLNRSLTSYFCFISFILSLVFVADTVLYSFWGFKIDSTVFAYTDKPAEAMASVSVWFVIAALLAILFFTALYSYIYYRVCRKPIKQVKIKKKRRLASYSTVFLFAGVLLFIVIRGGIGFGTANVTRAYYSDNQFLNHSAINPTFNVIYSMMHQQNFANEFRYMDAAECEAITSEIWNKGKSEPTPLLNNKRPNILMIIWESGGARMVKSLGGYADVTPGLEAIIKEGVLFTRCFSTSFRTDRGLVSIMSGWQGMPSATLMKIPNKCSKLPGLARSLAEKGYTTDFWYGGDISFTNMGGFMFANGFQATHSDKDIFRKEISFSEWGVEDGVLLEEVAKDILARDNKSENPWFTAVLTLSSHEPWQVPYRRLKNNIQNAFAYTDECISKLVNKLKTTALWDDLLVVIVPDHGVADEEGMSRSEYKVINIPFILAGGAVSHKGEKINTIMSQADIPATLLAQLGIDHSDFIFSRDVLNPDYNYPSAMHNTPVNSTFVDSTGLTTYDIVGEKVINTTDKSGDSIRLNRIKAMLQAIYDRAAEL